MEQEPGRERRSDRRGGRMATAWCSPVSVAVWFALLGLARPSTEREIADALGWFPGMVAPALARLRYARFVEHGEPRAGVPTWAVGNDLRRSLKAYGIEEPGR